MTRLPLIVKSANGIRLTRTIGTSVFSVNAGTWPNARHVQSAPLRFYRATRLHRSALDSKGDLVPGHEQFDLSSIKNIKIHESVHGSSRTIVIDKEQIKVQPDVEDAANGLRSRATQLAAQTFLPVGYPASVHKQYLAFHSWQAAETVSSAVMSVLCSQAMLSALGVGNAAATGGAVAIQWILKDASGDIARLVFINRFSSTFDSYPRVWKFVGETLNLVGGFFCLTTVLAPGSWFLALASLGNTLRMVHMTIWGVTHTTLARGFSLQGNMGDIVGKTESQVSAAYMAGGLLGVGLLAISHSPTFLFTCFACLAPAHLYFTLKSALAAKLADLNKNKLVHLIQHWIKDRSIICPDAYSSNDIFDEWNWKSEATEIKLADSVRSAFVNSSKLAASLKVFASERYMINYRRSILRRAQIYICFKEDVRLPIDLMKALYNAVQLRRLVREQIEATGKSPENWPSAFEKIAESSKTLTDEEFPGFLLALRKSDWRTDAVSWPDGGHRYKDESG